jgi:hypothetical protein
MEYKALYLEVLLPTPLCCRWRRWRSSTLQTCTSIGALSSILHLSRSMDADLHLDRESSEMKHKAPNLEGQERRSTSQNFALSKVLYLPSCNPNDQGMQIYFLTMRASRWNIKHPIFKYFSQRCCGVWRR